MIFKYGFYLTVLLTCGSFSRLHSLKQAPLNFVIVYDDNFLTRETIEKTAFTGYSEQKKIKKLKILEEDNIIKSIIDEPDSAKKTFFIFLKSDYELIAKRIYKSPLCWARGKIQLNNFVLCGQKTNQTFLTALTHNNFIEKKLMPRQEDAHLKNKIKSYSYLSFLTYAKEDEYKQFSTKKKKERCKYRKTCYNNDEYVEPFKKAKLTAKDYKIDKTIVKNETSKDELRLQCKYRLSCYNNNDLNKKIFDEKDKKQNLASILTSKPSLTVSSAKKPTTLKQLVTIVIKKLKHKEKSKREKPKISKSEKFLTTLKQEIKSKNDCKYRKSCYKTGIAPTIEQSVWLKKAIDIFKLIYNDEENKKIFTKFEDMSQKEQKIHCKYRKSCYKTGKYEDNLSAKTLHYSKIKEIKKKVPLQIRCKYRKSCYQTGNLPIDLQTKISKKKKELMPLNTINDLKLFCKYRKTCYAKMSEKIKSDGTKAKEDKDEVKRNYKKIDEPITKQSTKKEAKLQKVSKTKTKQLKKISNAEDTTILATKTKKKKYEKISKKISSKDQFDSLIKKNIPVVKRIKGKQPIKQIKNKVLDEEDIIKTSSKKPLKKVKKIVKEKKKNEMVVEGKRNLKTIKKSHTIQIEEDNDNNKGIAEDEKGVKVKNAIKDNKEQNVNSNGDNAPTTHNKEKIENKLKLACKYQKSCYQTLNNKNDDDKKNYELHTPPVKNNLEKNWKMSKEEQLKCKYRKLCYINIQMLIKEEQLTKKALPQYNIYQKSSMNPHSLNSSPKDEKDFILQINRNAKFKCKYRYSCYKIIKPHSDWKATVTTPKINIQIGNQNFLPKTRMEKMTAKQISKAIKHKCKYRHSCYQILMPEQTTEVEEQLNQIPSLKQTLGNRLLIADKYVQVLILPNGKVCNKYKRSCQEQLNIPAKEKIPIGKNGKKLCRKKKLENITLV